MKSCIANIKDGDIIEIDWKRREGVFVRRLLAVTRRSNSRPGIWGVDDEGEEFLYDPSCDLLLNITKAAI